MTHSKVYTKVTTVKLADNNTVNAITQEGLHDGFYNDLKNKYGGNDLRQVCSDHGIALTKKECLKLSDSILIEGYGTHSGRRLWQLPARLKNQISKSITGNKIE